MTIYNTKTIVNHLVEYFQNVPYLDSFFVVIIYFLIMKQLILFCLVILLSGTQLKAADIVSESIGAYTAGCIRNSEALSLNGEGWQVIRPSRGRYYGHPDTIEFIEFLSQKAKSDYDATLLIADISQQTGGPMLDDHSSHQIGLDADILLWQHPIATKYSLTTAQREHIHPQSVLNNGKTGVDEFKWAEVNEDILRITASDSRVDRIFLNPVIKKKLCKKYAGESWLGKIRPWYGHDGHFHVRLKCPKGNTLCKSQKPIESTRDGCGADLASWFQADGTIKTRKKSGSSTQRKLPDECVAIMYEIQ